MIPLITAEFNSREERSCFVAKRFSRYFADTVLDVSCFEAPLRALLKGTRYVGIDIAGKPDIHINLDTAGPPPFGGAEFSTVLFIEVLEHLDNLHHVFSELVRVSRHHVIVSLPNCWRDARRPIERDKGEFAHYGLPVEKPLDRHKWFFSFSEAQAFLEGMAARHGLRIEEIFATEPHRASIVRWVRRLRYPGTAYHDRYAQTVWVVFSKCEGGAP